MGVGWDNHCCPEPVFSTVFALYLHIGWALAVALLFLNAHKTLL